VDDKLLADLEFDRILTALRAETVTPAGAVMATTLRPWFDPEDVGRENRLTLEAHGYLERRGHLPFGTVPDPEPLLERLGIEGSVLAPHEVLDLVALMKAGRGVKSSLAEEREEYPGLWATARELPDIGNLVRFLDGKIASTGELEDSASDDLRAVRNDLRRRNERLKEILDKVVGRPEVGRALQDDFVSIRSERHVIPIRSEAQAAVPGIVHGVSGSGATVFVEPMETVNLNNEIVTLRDRETAEIQRLLQEYSDLLRGRLPELRALSAGIGRLDLLMARARLGRTMRARPAQAASSGALVLVGARHPLVEASLRDGGRPIVPLDLSLPAGTSVLVISGPNTGGKSVVLKTVGLLALMHQAGLMLPAAQAELPVYRGVFIDIGDRQSIPDRLSTFSARIATIAAIARDLRSPALVLLDEVGTGTDPDDGVALGIAVVDHFRAAGATVLVTTHLEALKAYAASTPGSANAAMQFDERTFTPTYRLVPGVPGRSGGLEIAAGLGLPESILRDARRRRGQSGEMIASYLVRLQEMTADLESRLGATEQERRRVDAERASLEIELKERGERQRQAIAAEIELALRAIREEGERYIASLKDREVASQLRRQEAKASAGLREEARRLIRRASGGAVLAEGAQAEIAPGMTVWVDGMGLRGTVDTVQGDRVALLVRGRRVSVSRADCRIEPSRGDRPASPGPRLPRGVSLERKPAGDTPREVQLRGLRVEDALELIDKYLDDAYLASLSPLRLVHGVGSGRLKRAVADLLARHPHVESFASAAAEEGGAGVTVVRLRL
jgi:DNA mismatch repair protein MutS2